MEPDTEIKSKEQSKKNITLRLRRIEGQVKGIEKMVDQEACCKDILIQIAAIRAAINKVGTIILENYATNCMVEEGEVNKNEEKIKELLSTLTMFLK